MSSAPDGELLSQDFELGFTYTRSTGPVVGRFLGALRERQILGVRGSDGQVIVPPMEYDPKTAEALSEFVAVGSDGAVQTWCWVDPAHDKHPLDQPFAWALIRLDGADVPMLHAVAAPSLEAMATGMRVRARWAEERRGHITDIACFDPI